MNISLTYNGDEILQDVVIRDAEFESQANGVAGLCRFRVRDDGHTYQPGYFKAGGVLELVIDGQLVWAGAVMSVGREYAFEVDDTSVPSEAPRFWAIEGADWNVLFTRRFVFDPDDPTADFPTYPGATQDSDVVLQIAQEMVDLSDDGIDLSGVTPVGPLSPFGEDFRPAQHYGETWGTVMNRIIASNGAIYYIDPDKVFQYRDVETLTAPFILSDQPQEGEVGFRDMKIYSSAADLANDALVWGAGVGSDEMVFARVTDDESNEYFGTFQWADMMTDVYLQPTVQKRAESHVYGSPTSHRGHREPAMEIHLTTFTPGLRVGMVAMFESNVFDHSFLEDVIIDTPVVTVPANLQNFMDRIGHIESNGNYTRQNKSSGAYGKYQIMPGNWRVWACDILGYPRSMGVSSKWTDGATWFPPTTPENQETVARTKFSRYFQWLGDWRRVAACWRSGGSVAVRQPIEWSRGTFFYVNHACEPLGFPQTTPATVLPPVGSTLDVEGNAEVQTELGFIDNRTSAYVAPVRKCTITFPTHQDAKFDYVVSHMYDQAFLGADRPPVDFPTIDNYWFTEVVPLPAPGGQAGFPENSNYVEIDIDRLYFYFVRTGSAGTSAGLSTGPPSVYSSRGIQNGFVSSIPHYLTSCGTGFGGFAGYETSEMWVRLWFPTGIQGHADPTEYWYEIVFNQAAITGYAPGFDVYFLNKPYDWAPSIEEGYL